MINRDKTYHCTANGVVVCYNDSRRHMFIEYKRDTMLQTQLYGNSYKGTSYQDFEDNRYSYQQNKLYQQCLYGLKVCTPAEVAQMSLQDKMNLQFNHKKTQQLINLSKWKNTSELIKHVFNTLFPSPCTTTRKFLSSTDEIVPEDNQEINMGSLKDIGGKGRLIDALIKNNILPSNFYNLKTA